MSEHWYLNCFLLIIPVLVWNLIFTKRLKQDSFKKDEMVPVYIIIPENALRAYLFLYPFLYPLYLQISFALILYIIGVFIYFASWMPLILSPNSNWSSSFYGNLAPAYTPILWLAGIGLLASSKLYLVISVVFVLLHSYRYYLLSRKLNAG